MSHSVQAHTLHIKPAQTIKLPLYTQCLGVTLDTRHNNCLLSTLQDDDREETEEVKVLMLRLYEELAPPNARHVGTFKDNSGNVYVFILKESHSVLKPAMAAVSAPAVEKKAVAAK